MIHKLSLSALALSILATAGTAHAATTVTHQTLRGRAITANFEAADGCYVAETQLVFGEFVDYVDGPPITQPPTVLIQIDYANACTGDVLSLAGGTTTPTFQILGDLSSATLSATFPVTDGVNTVNVSVDISLTANGDLQTAKGHFRASYGNETDMENFNVKLRNADDAGSITATLPLSTGPTPVELAQFGQGGTIGSDLFGDRTVIKKN